MTNYPHKFLLMTFLNAEGVESDKIAALRSQKGEKSDNHAFDVVMRKKPNESIAFMG